MGGGVVGGDGPVPAFADDLVLEDDQRADRHLALLLRPPGELERPLHIGLVGHRLKRASRQASAALRPCSRARSMKARLSGEPCDSMAWSISSAASSAERMPWISYVRLSAFFVSRTSCGSITAM